MLFGKPPYETPDVKQTYKRIKSNEYYFPENVPITPEAKDLIESILVLDPKQRLTLEEILVHPWISEMEIPKMLPLSTLACPPSANYLSKFKANIREFQIAHPPNFLKKTQDKPSKEKKAEKKEKPDENSSSSGKITLDDLKRQAEQLKEEVEYHNTFVSEWVDYSEKYGMGYLLTNRSSGMLFNDSTRLVFME